LVSPLPSRWRWGLSLIGLSVLLADLLIVDHGRHSYSPWRLLPPAAAVALLSLVPRTVRPKLGMRLPPPGQRAYWSLAGGASITLLVGWWTVAGLLAPHACYSSAETSLYDAGRGAAFVTAQWWFLGAVGTLGEEFIYRLGSLPHLIAGVGPVPALVVNAVAFTVLHVLYYHQFLWLYPIGALVYASLFVASRSAWVVLLAHYGTNLTASAVSYALWRLQCA
jgi:membrane protease YdiL (CAAX protease family)